MSRVRVVHSVTQFFAGVGSEAQAGAPPGRKDGAAGPAIALQRALGDRGEVVATVYCGDGYAAEQPSAIDEVVELIAREKPEVVVAGPAFTSGRYGLACGAVCVRVQEKLGIPAVTGMHPENAGADLYRSKVYIARTRETTAGMAEAIKSMARLALKRHAGEPLGSPQEEGYLPTGRRILYFAQQNAAERGVEMLLRKAHGEPYTTELPVPTYNRVQPAAPIKDLSKARIALVTTGGIVPRGNPDRLESAFATRWLEYSIEATEELSPDQWVSVHGGFDTTNVNLDPDRMAPLDALRELEKEGVFGKLEEHLYTTTGNTAAIPTVRRFAQEMVKELKAREVEGILLTSS
ncbi:MAG: glycine/betaine/sarcosine/D-proline family reductase selenoprotein B [Chloroflexi bacterium]|nr:glycine/betaine/sarcosine/D-proline family reductase selenoprotein B [Chloroflexota bacterium]